MGTLKAPLARQHTQGLWRPSIWELDRSNIFRPGGLQQGHSSSLSELKEVLVEKCLVGLWGFMGP